MTSGETLAWGLSPGSWVLGLGIFARAPPVLRSLGEEGWSVKKIYHQGTKHTKKTSAAERENLYKTPKTQDPETLTSTKGARIL